MSKSSLSSITVVEPYAKILTIHGMAVMPATESFVGIECLRAIELIGRVSHASEDQQTESSYTRFIPAVVISHGDWSIVEHVSATVDFLVDRGITHEIVRHRLASYTQESTRFVNYAKKKPARYIKPPGLRPDQQADWERAMETADNTYRELLAFNCAPQIARSVFPNALSSRLIMTCNLRNWRHFLLMRTTKEAHPQMKQVSIPLLEQFKSAIPYLFDDIIADARQVDNLKLPR